MTPKEALEILTNPDKLAEIEYYGGFSGVEAAFMAVVNAFTTAKWALEKQIPKKPISHIVEVDSIKIRNGTWRKGTTVYKCPNCHDWLAKTDEHCRKCGQAIDWKE